MGIRDEIERRIDRKRSEITELQTKIRDAEIYVEALEDTLKLLPREANGQEASSELRTGSRVAKARDYLRRVGGPQHVMEILSGIGEAPTAANRAALSGSLGAYVRKGEIFTRPSPNVFGLVEFGSSIQVGPSEPPEDFGRDEVLEGEPVAPLLGDDSPIEKGR
jgi:hypothetical protein